LAHHDTMKNIICLYDGPQRKNVGYIEVNMRCNGSARDIPGGWCDWDFDGSIIDILDDEPIITLATLVVTIENEATNVARDISSL